MKKKIKKIIKISLRNIIAFIIGCVYFIALIGKFIVKSFDILPTFVKASNIILMLVLSIVTIINVSNNQINQEVQIIEKEKIIEVAKIIEVPQIIETKEEKPKQNNLYNFTINHEQNIYNKAIEMGLTDNQAIIIISISRHETGNWKSKVFNSYYNFGGIMASKGLRRYNSYDEGLTHFIKVLKKYYFDKGLNTIEQIGAKYCPVGAANDPQGLNKNWVGGVYAFYNQYTKNIDKIN